MDEDIVYPNQIRPITEYLSADETIRRLKVSKITLQSESQASRKNKYQTQK